MTQKREKKTLKEERTDMIIYERIFSVCVFATDLMDMVLPTFTYAHTMFMNFSSTLMRCTFDYLAEHVI